MQQQPELGLHAAADVAGELGELSRRRAPAVGEREGVLGRQRRARARQPEALADAGVLRVAAALGLRTVDPVAET